MKPQNPIFKILFCVRYEKIQLSFLYLIKIWELEITINNSRDYFFQYRSKKYKQFDIELKCDELRYD